MAVIILGSGVTPVTGTREFDPIPGGSGGGDVSFGSGDTNNYIITSTGVGNEIQGEANLTFNGTVLTLTGNLTMPSGNITVTGMSSGATTSILHYNTGTGAITYGASGGGTTNFLRADGTWAAPVGSGVTKVGTPVNNELAVWTGDGTLEGESDLTYDGSTLTITAADFEVTGGGVTLAGLSAVANTTFLNMNVGTGVVSYTTSGGGTTNFLRADGTWAAPTGNVVKVGTALDDQVAVWTGNGTVEGSNNLQFDGGTLEVTSIIKVQKISELTAGQGIRFSDDIIIGADTLPSASLEVRTPSGSSPSILIDNDGSGYSLEIDGSSAATTQKNTITDAGTNTVTRALELVHETSGTAAIGFGSGIALSTEYDGGTVVTSGAIDAVITDATQGSGDADLSFKVNVSDTLTELAKLTSAGIFKVDTMAELTSSAGVTIEGVLFEDSDLTISTGNYAYFNVGQTSYIYDNAGDLTFEDDNAGPVTLSTLTAAAGDVTKVGTPADSQIGVWTGDGTIEGTAYLTFDDGTTGGVMQLTTDDGANIADGFTIRNLADNAYPGQLSLLHERATGQSAQANDLLGIISGHFYSTNVTPVLNRGTKIEYKITDVTDTAEETIMTFHAMDAGSLTHLVTLSSDGLEYIANHSAAQAANDRWVVDKGYVDGAVAAAGGLSASGSPANDQLAVWVTGSTLEGTANLTFSSSTLDVNNALTVDTIDEHTASAGVTVEGVELKDNNINLPASGLLNFGTGGGIWWGNDTGISETGTDIIGFGANAVNVLLLSETALYPTTTDTYDLGGTSNYYAESYVRKYYVDDVSTYIDYNSGDLRFTDASNSQITLSTLVAGASSVSISGTPANNQLAVWTNATTIEGDANLKWDGSELTVNGPTGSDISYTSCAASATQNITVGDTNDISMLLHYTASRNMGTVQQQSGTIQLLYEAASGTVYYASNYIGSDLDFTITADESGGSIRLNVIVGSDNVNALSFDSRVYSKFS